MPSAHNDSVSSGLRGQRADYLSVGLWIVAVAAAYFIAAKIGLQLALVGGQVTPLWPPTGIALACLLTHGIRCWPGITIGAFLVNVSIGPTLPAVFMISAGNTLAPVCAYLLLTRVGFRMELDRIRDAMALVFLAAAGSMMISATIGAGALSLVGALPPSGFWGAWSVWWAGDAMGVLVVTPVLLVARQAPWGWRRPTLRWLEALVLPVGIIAVMVVADRTSTPVFFLAFPLLVWAALRFQQRGAAPCALVIALIASAGAASGQGPFAELDLLPKMITVQAFNATIALTALLLAAVTTQRNQALRAVERAVAQLSEAVTSLEPYSLLRDGLLDNVLRARSTSDHH
jgi:integral membrane sensor domain MASE1